MIPHVTKLLQKLCLPLIQLFLRISQLLAVHRVAHPLCRGRQQFRVRRRPSLVTLTLQLFQGSFRVFLGKTVATNLQEGLAQRWCNHTKAGQLELVHVSLQALE